MIPGIPFWDHKVNGQGHEVMTSSSAFYLNFLASVIFVNEN